MGDIWVFFITYFWTANAVVCMIVADEKGRGSWRWTFMALLSGPLALIALVGLEGKQRLLCHECSTRLYLEFGITASHNIECPKCGEPLKPLG